MPPTRSRRRYDLALGQRITIPASAADAEVRVITVEDDAPRRPPPWSWPDLVALRVGAAIVGAIAQRALSADARPDPLTAAQARTLGTVEVVGTMSVKDAAAAIGVLPDDDVHVLLSREVDVGTKLEPLAEQIEAHGGQVHFTSLPPADVR